MFNENYGLINNILEPLRHRPASMWKHDILPGHVAIATMVNWRWTGYNALILLAAMQAVPRDLLRVRRHRRRRRRPPLLLDHAAEHPARPSSS